MPVICDVVFRYRLANTVSILYNKLEFLASMGAFPVSVLRKENI